MRPVQGLMNKIVPMKIFLFSRRFLIPFFIVLLLHFVYIEWQDWNAWKDELKGKGLPSSLIYQWLLTRIAGSLLILSFVNSFFIAVVFYSHHNVRKERFISSEFFSKWNLLAVILLSLTAFLYTSFAEPKNNIKTMELLKEIVWAKPGEQLADDSLKITPRSSDYKKNPRLMNINELFHAKDSLRALEKNGKEFSSPYFTAGNSKLRTVESLISKKFALPFVIILFYFLGIFFGASFYKIHVIVPLLISFFILLTGWYYVQRVFEWFYHQQHINAFLGANGTTIIFSLLVLVWFYVLKKYKLFKTEDSDEQDDRSSMLDTH